MRSLGTGLGGFTVAYDINEARQVAGYSRSADNEIAYAFLYQNGAMRDLGTFGPESSLAFAINNTGQITGSVLSSQNGFRPFCMDRTAHGFLGHLAATKVRHSV